MAALKVDGQWQPKIKLSNSREKVTLPGDKMVYRLYKKDVPKAAFADVIALADEELPATLYVINADPLATNDEIELSNFIAKPLQQEIVGQNAQPIETNVMKLQASMKHQLAELPKATQRLINPDIYQVYLTPKLFKLQQQLIKEHHQKAQS